MKRMDEVFDLPVTTVYGGKWSDTLPREAESLAVHAINHVDALADALEFLLNLPRGSSGRIIIEKSEELAALEVLRAYRGAK